MGIYKFLSQRYGIRFDKQPATVRHGVAAIGNEVHEHLFYLPAIGQNGKGLFCTGYLHFNIFPDQPVEKHLISQYYFVELDYRQSHLLLSAESQQALGKICSSF